MVALGVVLAAAIGDSLAKALLAGEIRDGDEVVVERDPSGDGLVVRRQSRVEVG